ncbi:MAG: hypothetical protein CVU97_06045 [Firmicutes bacterium HGW-Firmicutes-21]|nr:MAG: hypothetical protein CVU97_06045 [Firmicutes bacterium HGW-Firmicutes-21]
MLLFFEVICAYFAAVGLFFLVREAYYSLSEDKNAGKYVCIYIAKDGENESDARRALENEDFSGRVYVIYGDDRQTEKEITDLCIRYGRIYVKK